MPSSAQSHAPKMCLTAYPDAGSRVEKGKSRTPADESRNGLTSPIKLSLMLTKISPRTPLRVSYSGSHPSMVVTPVAAAAAAATALPDAAAPWAAAPAANPPPPDSKDPE